MELKDWLSEGRDVMEAQKFLQQLLISAKFPIQADKGDGVKEKWKKSTS